MIILNNVCDEFISSWPVMLLYSSETTYRYSVLRRLEDQGSAVTEDGDRGPCTAGEESDEVGASRRSSLVAFTVTAPVPQY